jgi:hypothetical protein
MNKTIIALIAVVVVILALLLVLAVVKSANTGDVTPGHSELALPTTTVEAEYERIRGVGLPITPVEADPWYKTPADNAAPLYAAAFDQLVSPSDDTKRCLPYGSDADLPPRGQALAQEMRDAMCSYVSQNASALALLHEGASHTGCRYPTDFSAGYDTDLTHLAKVRSATRLLCYEAAFRADEGDAVGAVRSLTSAFAMARSLRAEPCLSSQFVRYGCLSTGLETLSWVVNRVQLAGPDFEALGAALSSAVQEGGLWHGLVGERALVAHGWDARLGPGVEGLLKTLGARLAEGLTAEDLRKHAASSNFDKDLMHALTVFEALIRAAELPPEEGRVMAQSAVGMCAEAPEAFIVSRILLSSSARVHGAREQLSAQRRVALAGIAVARYIAANGSPPDSLAQLVPKFLPAVPLDPYDGQPLRYKKQAETYTVYSISKNLTDDGGKESATLREAWESGDITFVVKL